MLLHILTEPNPLLHKIADNLSLEQVKSDEIQKLIKGLIETMYAKDGVGIAATQAGKLFQVCVIAIEFTQKKEKDLVLINPQWEKSSILREGGEEGCLSVPGIYGLVRRYKKIKVKALDEHGNRIEFTANNFLARIVQHEADHLNGMLFIEKAKKIHGLEQEIL